MVVWAPPPDPPTNPPTSEKFFLKKKNEIYHRGLKFEVDFRCINFFFGL